MPDPKEPHSDAAPFGQQLYDELRANGLMSLLTRYLDYAQLQELKRADRAETAKLFPRASYAFRQQLKTQSARRIATLLLREYEKSEQALLLMLLAIG